MKESSSSLKVEGNVHLALAKLAYDNKKFISTLTTKIITSFITKKFGMKLSEYVNCEKKLVLDLDQLTENTRLCKTCEKEFPLDKEFFYMAEKTYYKGVCKTCDIETAKKKRYLNFNEIMEKRRD